MGGSLFSLHSLEWVVFSQTGFISILRFLHLVAWAVESLWWKITHLPATNLDVFSTNALVCVSKFLSYWLVGLVTSPLSGLGWVGDLQFNYSRTQFSFWDRLYEQGRTPSIVSNGMPNSNLCLGKEGFDWLTVGISVLNNILRIQSHFYLSHLCYLPGQQDGHQPLHTSSMTPSPRGTQGLCSWWFGRNFQW